MYERVCFSHNTLDNNIKRILRFSGGGGAAAADSVPAEAYKQFFFCFRILAYVRLVSSVDHIGFAFVHFVSFVCLCSNCCKSFGAFIYIRLRVRGCRPANWEKLLKMAPGSATPEKYGFREMATHNNPNFAHTHTHT